MNNNRINPEDQNKNLDSGNDNEREKKGQIDVDKNKTYDDDQTVNEDMKAGNPIGEGEHEEGHWTDQEEDKKPKLP